MASWPAAAGTRSRCGYPPARWSSPSGRARSRSTASRLPAGPGRNESGRHVAELPEPGADAGGVGMAELVQDPQGMGPGLPGGVAVVLALRDVADRAHRAGLVV